jgi:SNF2 family DNA or RNA helicase
MSATVIQSGDSIFLQCGTFDAHKAKRVSGFWKRRARSWEYPFGIETLNGLRREFPDAAGLQEIIESWEVPAKAVETKIPLFDHQRKSVEMALLNPRVPLLSGLGTGKTAVAISYLEALVRAEEVKQVLIICPLSLIDIWAEEIQRFSDILRPTPLNGKSTKVRLQQMIEGLDHRSLFITNYEFVRSCSEAFETIKFDAIVCDESTKIKNPKAKITKTMIQLSRGTKYRMIITATLIQNNPLDVFSQFQFLDPSILGTSYWKFREHYAVMGGFQFKEVVGWKNLDRLSKEIYSHSICFRKEDCLDLPEKVYKKRRTAFQNGHLKIYHQMEKQMIVDLESGAITAQNVLVKMLKLQQITSGFVNDENGNAVILKWNPKRDMLLDFLYDELPSEEKCVIFFLFTHSLYSIRDILKGKERTEILTGREASSTKRKAAIDRFQHGDSRFFLVQIRAGGVGISLTAARTCIFFENGFSPPGVRKQAEDRLHRIGQKRSVVYLDLMLKDSIDEGIFRALKRKEDVVRKVEQEARFGRTSYLRNLLKGGSE